MGTLVGPGPGLLAGSSGLLRSQWASFDLVQSSFLRFGFLFFCLRQKNGVVVDKQDRYTLRTWTWAPLGFD